MLWPTQIRKPETRVSWQHTDSYVIMRIEGAPSVPDIVHLLEAAAADSASWHTPALLLDLSAVRTHLGKAAQYLLGNEMGRVLSHLTRLAVLAAPGRGQATGERAGRAHGLNLRIFDDEFHALDWLLGVS